MLRTTLLPLILAILLTSTGCSGNRWAVPEPVNHESGKSPVAMVLVSKDPPVYRNADELPQFFLSAIRECRPSDSQDAPSTPPSIRSLFVGLTDVRVKTNQKLESKVIQTEVTAKHDNDPIGLLAFSGYHSGCQSDVVLWRFYEDENDLNGFFAHAAAFEKFALEHIYQEG